MDPQGLTGLKMTARAPRVQPGGRPCGAGPVTWPQQLCAAGRFKCACMRPHSMQTTPAPWRGACMALWTRAAVRTSMPQYRPAQESPTGPASWRSARHAWVVRAGTRTTGLATIGRLPCVPQLLRPRDWAGPAGPPPWLHAQRACRHFEPSEPLWVQLLHNPRATEHAP